MTRRGLGRGLDALLTSTESPPASLDEVPVASIEPNPYQPRHGSEGEELDDLIASVKAHGLIQPLVVKAKDEGYQLIAGERRWRAAQAAGLKTVPVVVRDASPKEMLALAIVENVQRSDLDPMETAEAYRRLMSEFDLSQADVAGLVGRSRVAVANTVRLLNLSEPVQRMVSQGALSEGHGRALLTVADPEAQRALAQRAAKAGWTVRRLEAEARTAGPGSRARGRRKDRGAALDPDTAAAVRDLEERLSTKVEILRRGSKGRLVIHFYSDEELSKLYDRLSGDG
jgi:ParB family chromosome partitioning protein